MARESGTAGKRGTRMAVDGCWEGRMVGVGRKGSSRCRSCYMAVTMAALHMWGFPPYGPDALLVCSVIA